MRPIFLYLGLLLILNIFMIGVMVGFTGGPIKPNRFNYSKPRKRDFSLEYLERKRLFTDNASVADEMFKRIRILCWIMTYPENHETKARHVKATWGKRCNVLLFMSSEWDDALPTVGLPVEEGRDSLWSKTKQAFRYAYNFYGDEADWFLKADDDTYVIMENLRYMLMAYKSSEPLYFGCRFKRFVKQGYMSGGAGYVLSKESLRRFVDKGIPNKTLCSRWNAWTEDVEIGKCLEQVGVRAMNSQDSLLRNRFFCFNPKQQLDEEQKANATWYMEYLFYKPKLNGVEELSDIAISFHYVSPANMYVLEYLIYYLQPVGHSFHIDFKLD